MSAQDHLNPQQFFHGSRHQFQPGDTIEPGHAVSHPGDNEGHMFVATRPDVAQMFADTDDPAKGRPHVYRVEPNADVTRHSDLVSGGEWKASGARVLSEETNKYKWPPSGDAVEVDEYRSKR